MLRRSVVLLFSFALLLPALGAIAAEEEVVDDFLVVPELREELVTPSPGSGHVWIGGYWERAPGEWEWVKGRWAVPPHKAAQWRPGHWRWDASRWHWVGGHWGVDAGTWIVEEPIPTPHPLPEARPAKPGKDNHWVAGHWDWDWYGGWTWIPGYETKKPDPKALWVPGHWVPYASGGYWWMGSHWKLE